MVSLQTLVLIVALAGGAYFLFGRRSSSSSSLDRLAADPALANGNKAAVANGNGNGAPDTGRDFVAAMEQAVSSRSLRENKSSRQRRTSLESPSRGRAAMARMPSRTAEPSRRLIVIAGRGSDERHDFPRDLISDNPRAASNDFLTCLCHSRLYRRRRLSSFTALRLEPPKTTARGSRKRQRRDMASHRSCAIPRSEYPSLPL